MEQRLIDANALYKKLENKYKCANGGLLRFAYKDAIDDVCNAPTIDPVKHGRWDGEGDGYADGEMVYDVWYCDQCDHREETDDPEKLPKYCPNCGARMDGGTP